MELTATLPIPDGRKLDPSLGPPVQLSVSSDELLPDGGLLLTGEELPARARLALGAAEGRLEVLLRVAGPARRVRALSVTSPSAAGA